MDLLDFILNLAGLLLWVNWRAARFDPLSMSRPATLAGTIRRAEKSSLRRWHLPLVLLGLLLLRVPLYSAFGTALNWTGKVDIGTIAIPFHTDPRSYLPMLLYSFYSFTVALTVFLLWALFLSVLKSTSPESDSLRQILRLHLGKLEGFPRLLKIILPFAVIAPVWWLACWPLNFCRIMPPAASSWARIEQAVLVGFGSYLALKYLLVGVLGLYLVSSYVYFGRHPFWQHLEIIARQILRPLRRLPLRLGRFDLAPLLGILLVWSLANAIEHGIKTPVRIKPDGTAMGRLIDIPGLVDLYARASH